MSVDVRGHMAGPYSRLFSKMLMGNSNVIMMSTVTNEGMGWKINTTYVSASYFTNINI